MRPRFQYRLRTLIVAVAVLTLALAYVSSYYRLSRRGVREARVNGVPGFLYVPFAEAAASEDLARHHRLARVYSPLNWIDRNLFGGTGPTDGIIWRIGE